jgi:lipopolysaccharide transport system permease protein
MTSSSEKLKDSIKIYEPNYIMKAGIRVWADMFRELVEFRGLIWRLIIRDLSARYKQSIFGILWAFITPLIMMLIFVWIKNKNILPIGETVIPYAAFVFTGQMVWLLFSQGVTTSANSLVAAGNMLTKINFPREVLIFSAIGQTIFDFLIRIPLLIIIFIWVAFVPDFSTLLSFVILVPLLLLITGLGFFLSLLNSITRDISSALGIIMNLGMFVTPVIYPPPETWPISFLINIVNPVSGFVTAFRDLMVSGHMANPESYMLSLIISLLIFILGWRFFHLAESMIAERV